MPDYTFPVLFGDNVRISSGIGSRAAPTAGASTNHRGIDIEAPGGTPVLAPADLEVIYAGQARGYGNVIYGRDAGGYTHRFAHLGGFNASQGQMIPQGAQLGTVGMTGTATGNHLHYEVRDASGGFLADATRAVVNDGRRVGSAVVDRGRELLGRGIDAALRGNPATAPFAAAASFLGFGAGDIIEGKDSCGINPICHLRKWLDETEFVSRAALWFVAMIFIVGAIVFLAKDAVPMGKVAGALK